MAFDLTRIFAINCEISRLYLAEQHGERSTVEKVLGVWCLVLAVLATVLNVTVVVSILRTRYLRTTANLVLVFLSLSDVLVGTLLLPISGFNLLITQPISCALVYMMSAVCFIALCLTTNGLLLVAADRYLAIFYPFHYIRWGTTTRLGLIFAATAFVSIFLGTSVLFTTERAIAGKIFFANVAVMLAVNIFVHVKCYRLSRRIRVCDGSLSKSKEATSKERRITSMVFIILCAVVICYFPHMIAMLFVVEEHPISSFHKLFSTFSLFLVCSNSVFNPLIYCWRNKTIRRHVYGSLRTCCRHTSLSTAEVNALSDGNDSKRTALRQNETVPGILLADRGNTHARETQKQ